MEGKESWWGSWAAMPGRRSGIWCILVSWLFQFAFLAGRRLLFSRGCVFLRSLPSFGGQTPKKAHPHRTPSRPRPRPTTSPIHLLLLLLQANNPSPPTSPHRQRLRNRSPDSFHPGFLRPHALSHPPDLRPVSSRLRLHRSLRRRPQRRVRARPGEVRLPRCADARGRIRVREAGEGGYGCLEGGEAGGGS